MGTEDHDITNICVRSTQDRLVLNDNLILQQEQISLSAVQVPASIKKRGRPKGSELTTIGLTRKKPQQSAGGPKPFLKMPVETKTKRVLQWLGVGQSDIKNVMATKIPIKKLMVAADSINNAVLDEHVDIYLVRPMFTATLWTKITKAVEDKRKANVWLCGHCNRDLQDGGCILCDCCLSWFHLSCCGVSRAPKKEDMVLCHMFQNSLMK